MRPHRGASFVDGDTGFVVVPPKETIGFHGGNCQFPPMETMSFPVGNFGELPAFEAGR